MRNYIIILFLVILVAEGCKKKPGNSTNNNNNNNNPPSIDNTLGFGLLNKIKGIWDGPVTSTTPLNGYPEYIVDFRPISENQISAKNELDTGNSIFMSFFIAKYDSGYKLAFRNGGSFIGMTRVSYFLCDSVSEGSTQSYYRFAEVIKGTKRAYTQIIFRNDSLLMSTFTNKENSEPSPTPHMTWNAGLQDTTTCQSAVTLFAFPKKTLTKDFSTTFNGLTESIYYSSSQDPYGESAQPYLGQTTINYSYAAGFHPDSTKKVFLLITTQPLIAISGPILANMKFRSRYVILSSNDLSFTFNYMHPGSYYVYALYDADGNGAFSSGDWVSVPSPSLNTSFTLTAKGTVSSSLQINYNVP